MPSPTANRVQSLGDHLWLGALDIEKEAVGIGQPLGAEFEVRRYVDRHARQIAQRPEVYALTLLVVFGGRGRTHHGQEHETRDESRPTARS